MSDVPLHHWVSRRRGFLERTLADLTAILDSSYAADEIAFRSSFLHLLDARVKLISAVILIVHSASARNVWTSLAIIGSVAALVLIARVPLVPVLRLWLTAGTLAAMLAVPAIFLSPGKIVAAVPVVNWAITDVGLIVAARLVLRALTSSTIAAVLVLTTPWPQLLKAMRRCGVPVTAVVLVGMSYRYIVVFLHTATELIRARKSRTAGRLPPRERRHLALSGIGVLLDRAMRLGNEVHLAMRARGFRGEFHVLDEFRMRPRDWAAVGCMLAFELLLFIRAPWIAAAGE